MRTTIRLNDDLLREAKAWAARSGESLNTFIETAVRVALQRVGPVEAMPSAYHSAARSPKQVREAKPVWPDRSASAVEAKPGDRLRRVLEREIWPSVPSEQLGAAITKAEVEAILGYGPSGA